MVAVLTVCALALGANAARAQATATYLYTLSTFLGPIHYNSPRIVADEERDEVYFLYQDRVRIFNANGMEVFSFGDDLDLGELADVAPDHNGDIILLSYKNGRSLVTRCNYRGVPIGRIEVTNLPAGVRFYANRMVARGGLLYFVDLAASRVVVTDSAGRCLQYVDFTKLVGAEAVDKAGAEMFGFTVDRDGSLLFTMTTLFRVYKLSPDGTLTWFGRAGSSAGRFGIVSGVATDSRGDVLVTDKLRSVVMVFDKDFRFLGEFGYRGTKPGSLIVPDDLAVDRQDHVYVSQARLRGVAVFALAVQ